MHDPVSPPPHRVVLIFTSFPVLSETFLQREVQCFQSAGLTMELVSLWGGESEWNGLPVHRSGFFGALAGLLWLPYWLIKKPGTLCFFLGQLWKPRSSGCLNWVENLLGFSYAMRTAKYWTALRATHYHAVWASAPGMAAWALHKFSGIPFSVSGHAYDLYEKGGDGWLERKAGEAEWIRTSTDAGRLRWEEKGAEKDKVIVVRRGLPELPPWNQPLPVSTPYRLLSVGRMVEKMGFDRQIPLFLELKEAGIPFSVEWIGDGPERNSLEKAVQEAGLADFVTFRGRLPFSEVELAYQKNQIFIFTGRIDSRGDRAGLPNAVAEAMAWGLLVFATDVGAVREAIDDGSNGIVWANEPEASIMIQACKDPILQDLLRTRARKWTEAHYQIAHNLGPLIARFELVTFSTSVG
ncbi:glycosyltransferase [Puniceicoccales bacterium CK1056]|uniref:Glycosyltransferase n=1 Tax=Oceanipulchritudo coccoides TaxID=2706888 RepID=A0A6B2M258_9BACT|nr:glycosyltransferase [Oceanipulchritudo coccoides]NDV62224.1 glycosyltransferase [Oceanipulchritudo coccoides]